MNHDKFDQFPKDYKTFAELAEYAKKRAKHSAARNGHQEFDYWVVIMKWANEMSRSECDEALPAWITTSLGIVEKVGNTEMKARHYAFAVHMRQMLINRGEKPLRLSLQWLRKAAQEI